MFYGSKVYFCLIDDQLIHIYLVISATGDLNSYSESLNIFCWHKHKIIAQHKMQGTLTVQSAAQTGQVLRSDQVIQHLINQGLPKTPETETTDLKILLIMCITSYFLSWLFDYKVKRENVTPVGIHKNIHLRGEINTAWNLFIMFSSPIILFKEKSQLSP